MRQRSLLAVIALALPVLAAAQGPQLELPSFTHLQKNATEVVDITIGSLPLGLASLFMDENDPESAEMKAVLKGLKSVRVRSYQFDSDYEYPKAEVDTVRSQLSGHGWTQLVQVRNNKQGEHVDVFVNLDNDKMMGFTMVASEPREFTIINIIGSIDMQQIARLQKKFNLPDAVAQASESDIDLQVP